MFSKNTKGFTLIEIIVATAIVSAVAIAITEVYLTSIRSQNNLFDQLNTQDEIRKVAQDFVNQLRVAKYSSMGSYPLVKASSTEIIFYSDLDKDAGIERIRYFLVSSTLKKGVIDPSGDPPTYSGPETITDVLHYVVTTTQIFSYYDGNYSGSGGSLVQPVNINAVRMVGINLVIDKRPDKSPVPISFQAKAELRNLKDN